MPTHIKSLSRHNISDGSHFWNGGSVQPGLAALPHKNIQVIGGQMGLDPTEPGSVFLFSGRKKNRMKALIFEGDGWLLCYKRLTGDCSYQWPRDENEARKLTKQQFRWLMEGLSIEQKKVIKDTKPDIY